jgi:hypothetical protein
MEMEKEIKMEDKDMKETSATLQEEGTFFSRDEILKVDDQEFRDVPVPMWGGKKVRIVSITAKERDAFEASMFKGKGKNKQENMENLRARLVQKTAVNPKTGIRLFEDGDTEALGRKNAAAMDLLFTAAMELCGMSKKDVEDMTENLD